ncbi:hypothetical protein LPJ57_002850 [Coemansia sp. RSA 486]|nr:hypothetical protein LPJ57_002850 [Coemansia sp. RSA 486]
MSTRVPTAFRPLETTSSFAAVEVPVPRRTATALPASSSYYNDSFYDSYAQERMQLLSRLEQRWYPVRASSCSPRSDCVAPVPRRGFAPSFNASRPSSSSSSAALEPLVAEDAACMELRGILCLDRHLQPTSRASSASSSFYGSQPSEHELFGVQQLEEIVIFANTPPARSNNPMPMDSGFGSGAY